jgi:hypothetical protein
MKTPLVTGCHAALVALLLLPAPRLRAEIKYVLHITCDGLRGDTLRDAIAATPEKYTAFRRLMAEGAYTFNARCDFDYSETIPNHTGVVTARPVVNPPGETGVAHGYTSNGYSGTATSGDSVHKLGSATYEYKFSTFDTVHDRGLSTAVYGGKTRFNLFVHSYNATKGADDLTGEDNGKNKIDFATVADLTTAANLPNIKTAVIADITAGKLRNYNLVHFTDTDTGQPGGGHNVGWESAAWKAATATEDTYLTDILAALDAAGPDINGKVAIVLTADHGGGGGGAGPGATADRNHGDASSVKDYTIPLFIWGPGIPPGIDAYSLFKNRADPAGDRPNGARVYVQPLRNTDTGNIAMSLLGLPFITGSYFKPEMVNTPSLTFAGGVLTLHWPKYLAGFTVESAPSLADGPWTPQPGEVVETETDFQMAVPAKAKERYWRLRGPQ